MTTPAISRDHITGLVLAGGRGERLGGVDKGLQTVDGRWLAQHALERLRPQVGPLLVSANRSLDDYASLGVPVLTDTLPGHPGPLAGMLAGLQACATGWLLCVPCDTPDFPLDLAARLADAAAAQEAEIAVAATRDADGRVRAEPVFCLLRRELSGALAQSLQSGERRVMRWASSRRLAQVVFEPAEAFFNVNTPEELAGLRQRRAQAAA